MKFYSTPKLEIVEIRTADIITLSADDPNAVYDDTANAPGGWFNF